MNNDRFTLSELITLVLIIVTLAMLTFCCGCGTKTVYVPDGAAVRLAEDLGQPPRWWPFSMWPGGAGVKVWVKDDNGKIVQGRMILPEGWYALPMEGGGK